MFDYSKTEDSDPDVHDETRLQFQDTFFLPPSDSPPDTKIDWASVGGSMNVFTLAEDEAGTVVSSGRVILSKRNHPGWMIVTTGMVLLHGILDIKSETTSCRLMKKTMSICLLLKRFFMDKSFLTNDIIAQLSWIFTFLRIFCHHYLFNEDANIIKKTEVLRFREYKVM